VVTLVADKLKRQWVQRVYFGNCIRQLERTLAQIMLRRRLTTTILDMLTTKQTSVRELHAVIKVSMATFEI